MEIQPHQRFATHNDRSCGLHNAPNRILCWSGTAKTMIPKQTRKCGHTGSPCHAKGGGGTSDTSFRRWHLVYEATVGAQGKGGGGWHEAMVLVCLPLPAPWPLATAHPDPLWVRTRFGRINGAPG